MTLNERRNEKGLSQEQLALAVGVTQASISAYELGTRRPSPEIALKIGEFLQLTGDEILQMFYGFEPSAESLGKNKASNCPLMNPPFLR